MTQFNNLVRESWGVCVCETTVWQTVNEASWGVIVRVRMCKKVSGHLREPRPCSAINSIIIILFLAIRPVIFQDDGDGDVMTVIIIRRNYTVCRKRQLPWSWCDCNRLLLWDVISTTISSSVLKERYLKGHYWGWCILFKVKHWRLEHFCLRSYLVRAVTYLCMFSAPNIPICIWIEAQSGCGLNQKG